MAMLRDEETQKKGVVLIVHCVRKSYPSGRDPVVAWKGMQLMRKILPMKLVGLHICSSPSSGMRFYYSHIAKFFDSAGIARTRFHEGTCVGSVESSSVATHKKSLKSGCCHTGTFEEIEQQLAGFGINGVNLAISYEGDLKVERHKGMLRSLKCLEAQTSSAEDYVILPTHTDVLLGRGKPIQTHPGNIRLSLIVESLLEEYNGSKKRLAKTQLAAETVDRMKGAGVRFLTKCDEGWKIALDSLARERVSSAFRTVRDRLKTQEMALLDSQLGDWDNSDRSKRMEEKSCTNVYLQPNETWHSPATFAGPITCYWAILLKSPQWSIAQVTFVFRSSILSDSDWATTASSLWAKIILRQEKGCPERRLAPSSVG
eukprot:scaffold4880_cov106-Cylindrotheca_fusiformis.AAC.3